MNGIIASTFTAVAELLILHLNDEEFSPSHQVTEHLTLDICDLNLDIWRQILDLL